MAISVKYLEGLGIDRETAEKIFAERGKEIEAEKQRYGQLGTKLGEKENDLTKITQELDILQKSNADAEEWKNKYETLTAEIEEKEAQAKKDQEAKEKADNIANRFEAVVGEKKFSHEAIKEAYHKKFGEALESKDFEGKSDADIFHELTKDDATAFEGVTAFKLEGGSDKGIGAEIDDAQARAVMGLPPVK